MNMRFAPVVSRVLVLGALVALNSVLPAQAVDDCFSCFIVDGQPTLCMPGASSGHSYCEPHEGHCDQAGPCVM